MSGCRHRELRGTSRKSGGRYGWNKASDGDVAATLGHDLDKAMRIATSGRPGPVHLSLPSDLLEERVESNAIVWPDRQQIAAPSPALAEAIADAVLAAIAGAQRPLILAGPALSSVGGRALIDRLEAATQAPAVIMESPRGIADATLGAFPDRCGAPI
jgi:acetolactate synthase-1/2/3 large subunit